MKPTFAVDCDGVLADFETPALAWLATQGIHRTIDEMEDWGAFNGTELEERYMREVAAKPGFCRGMRAFPGAVEFVRAAAEAYDVLIVTAPYNVPGWYDGRKDWVVEELGLPRKNLCFLSRKEFFAADALLDDRTSNLTAWSAKHPGKLAMLNDQPWNRALAPSPLVRVRGWVEISSVLRANGLPPIHVTV